MYYWLPLRTYELLCVDLSHQVSKTHETYLPQHDNINKSVRGMKTFPRYCVYIFFRYHTFEMLHNPFSQMKTKLLFQMLSSCSSSEKSHNTLVKMEQERTFLASHPSNISYIKYYGNKSKVQV